jgi:tetratricopeptide (TPR) repeat protein
MTIAGFDPAAVLQGDRHFFQEWADQATGRVAYDDGSHPSADDRAVFLESQLAPVVGELDFFHFDVRLYQLGRYHDAILLLNRFLQRFPGREVYGDLGLCHYQLAMRALARLDPNVLYRFQLPVVLDPVTLAERLRLRGGSVPLPADHPSVVQHLEPAIQQLEQALRLDPAYTVGRANLCAALIARGQYARALSMADEAPPDAPPDPALRECKAIALYLYGRDSGIDTGDNTVALLRELEQAFPDRASVRYNLGTILAECGRAAAARESWEAFLAREGNGEYADWVRQRLAGGSTVPPAAPARPATAPAGPAPVLPLGKPSLRTAEALKGMAKTPFELGEFSGAVYRGDGVRALELDFVLEVVEQDLAAPLAPARARELYGPPERTVPTPTGSILVYWGFALESDGGGIRTIIRFAGD